MQLVKKNLVDGFMRVEDYAIIVTLPRMAGDWDFDFAAYIVSNVFQ